MSFHFLISNNTKNKRYLKSVRGLIVMCYTTNDIGNKEKICNYNKK